MSAEAWIAISALGAIILGAVLTTAWKVRGDLSDQTVLILKAIQYGQNNGVKIDAVNNRMDTQDEQIGAVGKRVDTTNKRLDSHIDTNRVTGD